MTHRDIVLKYAAIRGYKNFLDVSEGDGGNIKCITYSIDPSVPADVVSCKSLNDFFDGDKERLYDTVFLDSSHICDDVFRDIETSLHHITRGGIILIHDCLPKGPLIASRTKQRGAWCGDVFKAVSYYFMQSPYSCYSIDMDYGIAVIDTSAKAVFKSGIVRSTMHDITYRDLVTYRNEMLAVIPECRVDDVIRDPGSVVSLISDRIKVLFITSAGGVDYQADALFNGLVCSNFDVTDSKYLWYLSAIPEEKKRSLYGRGFSIAGKLSDRSGIDRSSEAINDRIASHYYDCIVFGSIHRCTDFAEAVKAHYGKDSVAIVDGEDHTRLHSTMASNGIYFKRELIQSEENKALPISFAVPEEQFYLANKAKTRIFAAQVPAVIGIGCTRKEYDSEAEYYAGYSESLFAVTFKRGGWDCMRHYEIVAAGSVPYFVDFAHCPITTMKNWPRDLQLRANSLALHYISGRTAEARYSSLADEFRKYGLENLTTKALARYVVSSLGITI